MYRIRLFFLLYLYHFPSPSFMFVPSALPRVLFGFLSSFVVIVVTSYGTSGGAASHLLLTGTSGRVRHSMSSAFGVAGSSLHLSSIASYLSHISSFFPRIFIISITS